MIDPTTVRRERQCRPHGHSDKLLGFTTSTADKVLRDQSRSHGSRFTMMSSIRLKPC